MSEKLKASTITSLQFVTHITLNDDQFKARGKRDKTSLQTSVALSFARPTDKFSQFRQQHKTFVGACFSPISLLWPCCIVFSKWFENINQQNIAEDVLLSCRHPSDVFSMGKRGKATKKTLIKWHDYVTYKPEIKIDTFIRIHSFSSEKSIT